jgi:hypothetical protein
VTGNADTGGPGFARDIRPLFRDEDVRAMDAWLDLTSLDDVRTHAAAILERVDHGSMPCDTMWPEERVELFRRWTETGMAP